MEDNITYDAERKCLECGEEWYGTSSYCPNGCDMDEEIFNKSEALGRRALSKDEQREQTIERRKLWPDFRSTDKA